MSADVLEAVLAQINRRTPEEVQAHPRFSEARARFLTATTLSIGGDDDPRLRQLMNSLGRSALFSVIIGRYFRYDVDDRDTWPTVKRIKERYLPLGFARSRTLDQVLARLCVLRLVGLDPHPLDRRTRLVLPSRQTLDLDRRWLADQFTALEPLYPENEPGAALRAGDVRYQRALRHLASHTMARTQTTLSRIGPLRDAVLRQDGMRILTTYLLRASESGTTTLNLPFRDVEQAISTSRTHIRHLFQTLETLGMVKLHEPGGRCVELSPTLIGFVDRFVATILSNYDVGWTAARWLVENEPLYAQQVPPEDGPELLN